MKEGKTIVILMLIIACCLREGVADGDDYAAAAAAASYYGNENGHEVSWWHPWMPHTFPPFGLRPCPWPIHPPLPSIGGWHWPHPPLPSTGWPWSHPHPLPPLPSHKPWGFGWGGHPPRPAAQAKTN
ncbi:hypothetical protein OWV82_019980 [Melia azedarach]|uniref:Uncharacterized protein n=1 Tax=Melia azedarach TaxID=155640 RepID=A0ACC1X6M9_MELAZ|nr:hypothetical protein OWV82_019980 [Melia azedarach]